MARLIDKDALMKQIRLVASRTSLGETKPNEISSIEVIGLINDAPTVDAVEVVRCKDCRMFVHNKAAFVTYCNRELKCLYANPDGYCSYGERKESDNEG